MAVLTEPVKSMKSWGAFVEIFDKGIRTVDEGPLSNLSFAVKDLIDIAGTRTGCGNPDWFEATAPAQANASCIESLLAAGATCIGKTITDELAFSLEGANAHYGTPENPLNASLLPGGSSSGSAVCVAAGLTDFALGTDTGGSVRVPAAFCDIFGFRPTHGTVSLHGVMPFAPVFDCVGWFARKAAVLRSVGAVLLPQNTLYEPVTKICLAADTLDHVEPEIADRLRSAETKWANCAPVKLFDRYSLRAVRQTYEIIQGFEIAQALGARINEITPRFGKTIEDRFAGIHDISQNQYKAAMEVRRSMAAQLSETVLPGTAVIIPTASVAGLEKTASREAIGAFYGSTLGLTSLAGHAGLPQINMKSTAKGGKGGVSLLGARHSDAALLDLAVAIDENGNTRP